MTHKLQCEKQMRRSEILSQTENRLSEQLKDVSSDPETADKTDVAELYNERGFVRYLMVEFKSAVRDFDEALKWDDKMAIAYYNRGTIHYRLGHFESAVTDFRRTVGLSPQFNEAIVALSESKKHLQNG